MSPMGSRHTPANQKQGHSLWEWAGKGMSAVLAYTTTPLTWAPGQNTWGRGQPQEQAVALEDTGVSRPSACEE